MPAVSKKQATMFRIAEHAPEKLHKKNRGVLGMTRESLHEFASTPEKELPEKVSKVKRLRSR
jgi:hypothetical protein